jgi:hypothetical protein
MEEILLWSIYAACSAKKSKNKRIMSNQRSRWSREWLLKRHSFSHVRLLRELRDEAGDWRNYLRVDVETYNHLLNLVTPHIEKKTPV